MDLVVDANVMSLYDAPTNPDYASLFRWLGGEGRLAASRKLLNEYARTSNQLLAGLINRMLSEQRIVHITKADLEAFTEDRHFNYTCNFADQVHARAVFLSLRKRLVSNDTRLVDDVNRFPRINKIKPQAVRVPSDDFFQVTNTAA